MNPLEYTFSVQGFGLWRIAYVPDAKRWRLAYNVRVSGAQWTRAPFDFVVPESAAIAVGERTTGIPGWDRLRFAAAGIGDLLNWKTTASEGVQPDALD